LPGVVLSLLVWLTIREPVRGALDDPADLARMRAGEDVPFWQIVGELCRSPTFRIMSLSAAPSALCGYGMNLWMPSFIQRVYELPQSELTFRLGLAIGVGGGLGAWLGGAITGRAAQKDPRAFLTLPALTMAIFAFAMLLAVFTSSLTIVYSAIFVAAFTQFYLMGPFFAMVQRLAPLRGRAVATAFFFFILATVGIGLGPFYVGVMNDLFRDAYGDAEGLRLALMTLPIISLAAGAVAFFGRNAVIRDAERIGGAGTT
jgi:MFS family permease